jgi:hypothetical protein
MSWSIGYDENWKRDIGYGVPSICDHPGCTEEINRGLGYVCGEEPYGGEKGCGLFFCERHRGYRCKHKNLTPTPDTSEWIAWKLTHESWQRWRDENPNEVALLRAVREGAA